jgi:hypothetical protein
MHESSTDVLTQALHRLKKLAAMALSPAAQDEIQAQISTVQLTLDAASIVAARLEAAKVAVKPIEDSDAARLSALGASLDEVIEHGAVLTAGVADVARFVGAASEVHEIIAAAVSPAAAKAG